VNGGAVPDLEVNRSLRKVFVRHWIDIGRLFISVSRGNVLVRGILQMLPGAEEPLTSAMLVIIFRELRSCNGVREITTAVANWEQISADGFWRPKAVTEELKGELWAKP